MSRPVPREEGAAAPRLHLDVSPRAPPDLLRVGRVQVLPGARVDVDVSMANDVTRQGGPTLHGWAGIRYR